MNLARPLFLAPVLKEKIWGGEYLAKSLNDYSAPKKVGEAWLISTCGADASPVINKHAGIASLADAMKKYPVDLCGLNAAEFPLLCKFIDANESLSVQVHPDDTAVKKHGWGTLGKTECWYIVEAKPGAEIILGLTDATGVDEVAVATLSGDFDRLLRRVPVKNGDVFFVPAGTVHAILGGLVIYEVQQSSDITFRLFDWNRPRELQIKESLLSIDFSAASQSAISPLSITLSNGATRIFRCVCRYFALEEFLIPPMSTLTLPDRKSFSAITTLEGSFEFVDNDGSFDKCENASVVVPASISRSVKILAGSSGTRLLHSSVPEILAEVIEPLRATGFSDEKIAGLGGSSSSNDLIQIMKSEYERATK